MALVLRRERRTHKKLLVTDDAVIIGECDARRSSTHGQSASKHI